MRFFDRMRSHFLLEISVGLLVAQSIYVGSLGADLIDEQALLARVEKENIPLEMKYTVNFNNVSVVEFIRFVSKISGLNFLFEDADLGFTVTIVSEEPISIRNILSALVQILRVHNLQLIEQDNNLLITASPDIRVVAPVVTSDIYDAKSIQAPIITRVFRIKNANPNSLANIIRPMTSKGAIVDVALETRQLIVTDVATNIDKISDLLANLDAPHNPLDIDTYVAKALDPQELIKLTEQILAPFADGNPLIMVPHEETRTVFIVSTPFLIEKALTVLEDLDTTTRQGLVASDENIFIYKIQNKAPEDLVYALKEVSRELRKSSQSSSRLYDAVENVRWIKYTNSLLFVADKETQDKLKILLSDLDQLQSTESQFLLYNPVNRNGKDLERALKEIAHNLKIAGLADISFLHSVETMRWVPDSNALLFTADPNTLAKIDNMLKTLDVATLGEEAIAESKIPKSSFLVYRPLHLQPDALLADLKDLATDMSKSGLLDPELIYTLESARYVESSGAVLFTGTAGAIEKTKDLLITIDVPGSEVAQEEGVPGQTFILYKPKNVSVEQLMSALRAVASGLSKGDALNQGLISSIHHMKWIKESDSILFTGSPDVLKRIQELLQEFDQTGVYETESGKQVPGTYILYSPKYQPGPDLLESLKDFEKNLQSTGIQDSALYFTINHIKWMPKTATLLISGEQQAVQKVQDLLARFDTPSGEATSTQGGIEPIENTNFLIYKLQYHKGEEIRQALKDVAKSLANSGGGNQDLVDSISSLQWIKITNSIIATGPQAVLTRLRELISNLDVPLRQIFIEVLVIQTNLTNSENIGLQWAGQVQYLTKFAGSTGNFPVTTGGAAIPPTPMQILPNIQQINGGRTPQASATGGGPDIPFPPTGGFDLGVIGDLIFHRGKSFVSLASFVQALEQDSNSTILLNPKIITQDSNNSTIFVGQNIPFPASTVQTQGGINIQQTSNLEYRDVGVNLSITPVVGLENIVTLDVTVDISQQIDNTIQANQGLFIQGVQTSHANMSTRVHVPDKAFVALSGMIGDTKTRFKTGIPCLGGLPVIGAAFSQNARQLQQGNIIIFLRPYIINSIDTYREITENQENLYRDEARYPILKEEFDAGLDLVKTPEDER